MLVPKKRELQTFLYQTSLRSVAGNDGDLNDAVFSPRLLGLRLLKEGRLLVVWKAEHRKAS